MDHRNRAKLIDVPERRSLAQPLELRKDTASGQLVLEGYASTWDPYDCYGGPEAGGWVEQIDKSSMTRTLNESPDLMLLVNHEGLPLARTTSDTLKLNADKHGLFMRAYLDPDDPDVQRLAPKLKPQANGRSNMDEMSFAFRVKDQVWNRDYTNRLITELSLQKGDVSVVNYGMNPNTIVSMPSMVGALAQLSQDQLCEVRKLDNGVLMRAAQTLATAASADPAEDERGVMVNFDGSHLLHDGACVTCAGSRSAISTDAFADPGYLDEHHGQSRGQGMLRWPVDETHVKASYAAFQIPRNQSGYTDEQVSAITSRIKAAMQKAGHAMSDSQSDDPVAEISHIEAVRKFGGGTTLVAVHTDGSRTPLPNFRQSGEMVGSGAGDGGNPFGSGLVPPTGIPSLAEHMQADIDPRSAAKPKDGSPPVEKDPQDKDPKKPEKPDDKEKPARAADDDPDDDDETEGRGKPPWVDDDEEDPDKKRAADDPEEDPDERSASQRLAELRKEAELPDLPTVSEGLAYIRQLV
jgi:HK97 family phage prohead protease